MKTKAQLAAGQRAEVGRLFAGHADAGRALALEHEARQGRLEREHGERRRWLAEVREALHDRMREERARLHALIMRFVLPQLFAMQVRQKERHRRRNDRQYARLFAANALHVERLAQEWRRRSEEWAAMYAAQARELAAVHDRQALETAVHAREMDAARRPRQPFRRRRSRLS